MANRVAMSGGAGGIRCVAALVAVLGSLLIPAAATAESASAVVLMYHRFGETDYPSTNIRIEQFEAHLAELASGAYHVVALPEITAALTSGRTLAERSVAVTVDDAYLSVYRQAWPRFQAAGIPFTLFVPSDAVDQGQANYMSWAQIREMAAAGVGIGHHSAAHGHMATWSRARVKADIDRANRRFREELGFVPKIFAHPYGEASRTSLAVVAEAGFEAAFGQHSGVAQANLKSTYLPRFALNEAYGGLSRLKLVASALPLPVSEITPADPLLSDNPPTFGFTLTRTLEGLSRLRCFPSHEGQPAHLEILGGRRVEVRPGKPFPPGRGRINCTLPGQGGRWHWFGMQFYAPKS